VDTSGRGVASLLIEGRPGPELLATARWSSPRVGRD